MNAKNNVGSTQFLAAVPILAAQDLSISLAFYESLGFLTRVQYEDYAIFMIGDEYSGAVEIHLWQCDDRYIAENTGCRVQVENIEPLHEKCLEAGAIHSN